MGRWSKDSITVTLVTGDVWDFPFWNKHIEGRGLILFKEWLDAQIAAIPPEYLETANINIDSKGGYEDEHHATISIDFIRPMTAAEMEARDRQERDRKAMQTQAAFAEYTRLKNMFEGKA